MTAVNVVLTRLGLARLRLGSFGAVPPPEPPLADLEALAAARDGAPLPPMVKHRFCRRCQVTWTGMPECWCCGKPVAGIG